MNIKFNFSEIKENNFPKFIRDVIDLNETIKINFEDKFIVIKNINVQDLSKIQNFIKHHFIISSSIKILNKIPITKYLQKKYQKQFQLIKDNKINLLDFVDLLKIPFNDKELIANAFCEIAFLKRSGLEINYKNLSNKLYLSFSDRYNSPEDIEIQLKIESEKWISKNLNLKNIYPRMSIISLFVAFLQYLFEE